MTWIPMAQKHYYDSAALHQAGLSHYQIRKLVDDGVLIKHGNKVYENTGYQGAVTDFSVVTAFVPKGVICMLSAARFYGLTTYLPDAVDVAIGRTMKVSTLPDWPALHAWYFPEERYTLGLTSETDEAGTFRIYDREKTVVDLLYYRNKAGIEESTEVLKNYLSRPDRNLPKLHRYANTLGCAKILSTYLEVLL